MTAIVLILFVLALGVGLCVGGVKLVRLLRLELAGLRSANGSELAQRNAEVERRLEAIVETMDRRLGALDVKVDSRLGQLDTKVDQRMASAAQTSSEIYERLGKVDEGTAQMLERAKDLSRLEQALRPPKARGGFGELLLGNLLADRLPPGAYDLQHTFSTGDRVDAVVKVDRLVPIDSKFPLDNFMRVVEAATDDERTLYEKAFARDVKSHVDAIANKYILPAEGTYDFALMYIASEAVYYELVCGKTGQLQTYALEKRVFPVSPTTLTSQLQVIALGLKGLQIEQHAHDVMAYVAQLQRDFGKFRDDFELVGTHLGRAQTKYSEAGRRFDKIETKLDRATDAAEIDGEVEQASLDFQLPAVDAA